MKHTLSMTLMFSLATTQVFSYSTDTLQNIADLSGSMHAASELIAGVSKSGASKEINDIGGISKEVNNLMSYALMDAAFTPRIARVISRINKEASWQTAGKIDDQFFKAFASW